MQELLDKKRRPPKDPSKQGLFSGLVYCPDCGSRLYYYANHRGKINRDSYHCGKYSIGRGECTAHYVRETVLRDIVLEQIKDIISYVTVDAIGFADEWMHSQHSQREKELRKVEKRLTQARKRYDEIDNLLMRTYEDYANGILSLERYQKMSTKLEQEQAALNEEIAALDKKVRRHEKISDDFDRFIELVGKYADITELTPTIVNEFIKKIFVHEADNSTGKRTQQIEIIFNFIGDLDIPAAKQTIDSAKDADEKTA